MSEDTIRIVGFDPRWREDFATLNIEWLEHWFEVEPFDREVLGNPERYILTGGGRILFAVDDADIDPVEIARILLANLADRVHAVESAHEEKFASPAFPYDQGLKQSVFQDVVGVMRDLPFVDAPMVGNAGMDIDLVERHVIISFGCQHFYFIQFFRLFQFVSPVGPME